MSRNHDLRDQRRRRFLKGVLSAAGGSAALAAFPPILQQALAVEADRRSGTLEDVAHIVVLTQENRSFDHYFGAMNGVRGFADPFPVPVADGGDPAGMGRRTVWLQPDQSPDNPALRAPFPLNTRQRFAHMRVEGTPHSWADAQQAWDHGRMAAWTRAKYNHSLGYFDRADLPFQYALADAFTLCDAYHCATQTGTNTNRLFLWTGSNDPLGRGKGPATYNDYDHLGADPGHHGGYDWTTYPERLEAAGVTWQVYQDLDDNFSDNPLEGFRAYRDAWFRRPGAVEALRARGIASRDLDLLRQDVLADRLPQVSWVIATAAGSEHPGPSSPAQGAAYTARLIEALTANPKVWARTVLLINFDENDGFFDHVPPPAPPSYLQWDADPGRARLAGASTVDTTGEYHEILVPYHSDTAEQQWLHRPYGLGPRVPMYVVSPWSKGGWVNSELFDHTSVIRLLEARFGVAEPNISPWRRAVCGDLTSCFDFSRSGGGKVPVLPSTAQTARQAAALPGRTLPPIPATLTLPEQPPGPRPSRALPYAAAVDGRATAEGMELTFRCTGSRAMVFHVYDRLALEAVPRRYTVEPGKFLSDGWAAHGGAYDLWVMGPNGFLRHLTGRTAPADSGRPEVRIIARPEGQGFDLRLENGDTRPLTVTLTVNRYGPYPPVTLTVPPGGTVIQPWSVAAEQGWYDLTLFCAERPGWQRRFAGRLETGRDTISDPAMHGPAVITRHAPA